MKTVVIGAGRLGHGVALCYAIGGHDVIVIDTDDDALARAAASIDNAASVLIENRLEAEDTLRRAVDRISLSIDMVSACTKAELIQEAIPEDLPLKQKLFASIEDAAPAGAILSTNTSSLRINAVAHLMRNPERLVGIHWVAPPYLVPIVEIVRSAAAPDSVMQAATAVVTALGKIPIVVPDVPGFALNRLQYALYAAAVDLIDQGILEPTEIDLVIRYAMAPRLLAFGMLEQFDLIVSGRTIRSVANYLYDETGDTRYRPSRRIDRMVEEGRLGLISGAGWFEYDGSQADIERRRDATFAQAYRALAELDARRQQISAREPLMGDLLERK